jgi:phosphonate transport system substrate-binding protein
MRMDLVNPEVLLLENEALKYKGYFIKTVLVVLICLSLSSVSGCKESKTPPAKAKPPDEKSIIIGLIPEQNIFRQMERYEPLASYLSKKIGAKIKLKVLPRYGNIIDNFVIEGMDGAFFGSFTYSLAHAKLGVEVLARPEDEEGVSSYHGLLFVRKDSNIATAADMKGKRFAFVDKATTAGYLLPMAFFKQHGIGNHQTYLKEFYFAGTHEDVIYDVLHKKTDIGAAKNTVFERLAKNDQRISSELLIIEKSPAVPENGLAVRKDLEDSLKKKLKEALLDMHNEPEGRDVLLKFGARSFVGTDDRDYWPVSAYAEKIGLNLSVYDYLNQ